MQNQQSDEFGVFVYGNIMTDEVLEHIYQDDFDGAKIRSNYPVSADLQGFRRFFGHDVGEVPENGYLGQPVSNTGALTVEPSEGDRVTGLVIPMDQKEFESYVEMEEGYDVVDIDESDLTARTMDSSVFENYDELKTVASRNPEPEVEPIMPYLEHCLEAAGNWSRRLNDPEFEDDFLETTWNNGQNFL